jgi:hypothetical protein
VREIEEKQFLKLLVDQLASFHFLIELVGMSQLKVSSPKPQLNLAKNGGKIFPIPQHLTLYPNN